MKIPVKLQKLNIVIFGKYYLIVNRVNFCFKIKKSN